jgi:hypothetical protein
LSGSFGSNVCSSGHNRSVYDELQIYIHSEVLRTTTNGRVRCPSPCGYNTKVILLCSCSANASGTDPFFRGQTENPVPFRGDSFVTCRQSPIATALRVLCHLLASFGTNLHTQANLTAFPLKLYSYTVQSEFLHTSGEPTGRADTEESLRGEQTQWRAYGASRHRGESTGRADTEESQRGEQTQWRAYGASRHSGEPMGQEHTV